MPKPKPKSSLVQWTATDYSLSDIAREELESLLELDTAVNADHRILAAEAIREVEKCLGFYPGAKSALTKVPRAADYKHAFASCKRDVLQLRDKFRQHPIWVKNAIDTCMEHKSVDDYLSDLAERIQTAERGFAKHEGRGRLTDEARDKVILKLREIYQEFSQTPKTERPRHGAITPLSEYEGQERDFIRLLLNEATIPCPKVLLPLLNKPETTVRDKRRERERIYKKTVKKTAE